MAMKSWLTKPWVFGLLVLTMGAAFGALSGVFLYAISKLAMPWLTQSQLDLILPAFLLIGIACALYCLGLDIFRGWGKPK